MPTCELVLAAKGIVRDADSNSMSIFHIIEEIGGRGLPIIFPELAVLAMWKKAPRERKKSQVEFKVLNNSKVIFEGPVTIDFKEKKAHRTTVKIAPLVINEQGTLSFQFIKSGKTLGKYEIVVSTNMPEIKLQKVT